MPSEIIWTFFIPGVLIGLFGWTLYWAGVQVIGAFVGASAGGAAGAFVTSTMTNPENEPLIVLLSALLGLVLGIMLMRTLNKYFFFVMGALLGGPAMMACLDLPFFVARGLNDSPLALLTAIILGGLVGGIITVRGQRYIIALVGAVAGAALIGISLPPEHGILGGGIALTISIAAQTGLIRYFSDRSKAKKALAEEAA